MTGKLLSLSLDGQEIMDELSFSELPSTTSLDPHITPVSLDAPVPFFKLYLETLKNGDVPLVLNPSIPETKRQEITSIIRGSSKVMSGMHILCSSGTTSQAVVGKQFVFNIKDALNNGRAHLASIKIDSSSRLLLPLPLTHSFGLVAGLLASHEGGHELYTLPTSASTAAILGAIEKYHIDHLYLTPSLLKMMVKYLKRKNKTSLNIRSISIGSSLLFIDELLSLMSFFPKTQFYFTYGLTEMGPRTFTFAAGTGENPHPYLNKEKTGPVPIGEVIGGVEYKIIENELWIKSPYAAQKFQGDFFQTFDRSDFTAAGVRVHGRLDFTIIKSGINIYPAEIEGLLSGFPGIKDCALVPLKSESYGQVPVLIVHSDGRGQQLSSEIFEFLKINLPASHLPSRIVVRTTDFPRTAMGKIKINSLIEELAHE